MNKGKKIFALGIGVIFFLQFVVPAAIVVNYWLNRDYIEQAFCVNIDKPEMNCHGQCHMQKQISKVTVTFKNSSDKENVPTNQVEIIENIAIQNVVTEFSFSSIMDLNKVINSSVINFYQSRYLKIPSPPPKAILV